MAIINFDGTTGGGDLLAANNLSDVADASTSLGNLGGAASGANSDITSLSGLTTPLSVAQGGSGAATLTGVLKGNGTSAFGAAVDGTDYISSVAADTTPQLGGSLDAQDKNITGLGSVSFTQELDNGSKTGDFSVDFSTDQKQKCTLTANAITLTLDTTSVGVGNYTLKIVNGGLATLTWASETGAIYFPGGTDPSLTASGTDIVSLYFDGTNWYGQASLDFS